MVCYNPLIGFKKEGIVTRNGKLRLNILGSLADYQYLEGKSGYEICPCGYCIDGTSLNDSQCSNHKDIFHNRFYLPNTDNLPKNQEY